MVEGIIGDEFTPLTNEEAGAKLEEWLDYIRDTILVGATLIEENEEEQEGR